MANRDPNEPAPHASGPRDPAMGKFYLLQLVRLGSIALVLIGVLTLAGRIGAPEELGYALFAFGAFAFFFGPRQLARKWKAEAGE